MTNLANRDVMTLSGKLDAACRGLKGTQAYYSLGRDEAKTGEGENAADWKGRTQQVGDGVADGEVRQVSQVSSGRRNLHRNERGGRVQKQEGLELTGRGPGERTLTQWYALNSQCRLVLLQVVPTTGHPRLMGGIT